MCIYGYTLSADLRWKMRACVGLGRYVRGGAAGLL